MAITWWGIKASIATLNAYIFCSRKKKKVLEHSTWSARRSQRVTELDAIPGMPNGMPQANADMVAMTLSPPAEHASGAICVVNISSEHVPGFCLGGSNAYLNAYDLVRLGKNPEAVSATRERVDQALAELVGQSAKDIYFVAAELNGTGIRFYGDICLVLESPENLAQSVILESNSYDLVRAPKSAMTTTPATLLQEAQHMSGRWGDDLSAVAAIKIFAYRQSQRRLTTGQVSDGLLDDEDYIEVLRIGSFSVKDVKEARLSAASVAEDGRIDERLRSGPIPDAASLKWRHQRRQAERSLVQHGVPVRVVSTTSRTRS
ncbi:hypothetical protein [Gluconacetobacter takamatsuzukensis]|uniref:Uncharacterized protein n=1 Tax=Gluconacetobacter takamatsuzukensis TaxID=1286190 RepID=A0A7W4KGE1_9PROT|nr:hypothetical protein [Gluconacetobacter takamatsuzukensis]MBB2206446.1 hypothetical protein [Gluconacetobacter takamatsuzukensis]